MCGWNDFLYVEVKQKNLNLISLLEIYCCCTGKKRFLDKINAFPIRNIKSHKHYSYRPIPKCFLSKIQLDHNISTAAFILCIFYFKNFMISRLRRTYAYLIEISKIYIVYVYLIKCRHKTLWRYIFKCCNIQL